jgi:hypothetical protein
VRRAAVGTSEQRGDDGARWCFAGAASGRGSWRPKRARASATRSGGAREHAQGVRVKRGRPRWTAPEGGGSASLASSRDQRGAQRKGKGAEKFFAHHAKELQRRSWVRME